MAMTALKADIEKEGAAEPVPEALAATEPAPERKRRGRPPGRQPKDPTKSSRPPSRVGKKAVVGHFSNEMHIEINILSAKTQRTVQDLLGEALDLILKRNGMKTFHEYD